MYAPIVTLLAALALASAVPAHANEAASVKADAVLVEMQQAYKRGDRARLSKLLPQARNHALEPWAAYWELRARLGEVSAQELKNFFERYAGTYQEDRLRADWLLVLGRSRDWGTFAAEYAHYRMRDERELRCYELVLPGAAVTPATAQEVRTLWLAQNRESEDGCSYAVSRLLSERPVPARLSHADVWRKARLALDANRPGIAAQALELVAPQAQESLRELAAKPTKFLLAQATKAEPSAQGAESSAPKPGKSGKAGKSAQARKTSSTSNSTASKTPSSVDAELITLALIRLTASDHEGAAQMLDKPWAAELSAEQHNWVMGVVGQRSALRLEREALDYYGKVSRDADLSDEMLGWKVRAALRAGAQPRWSVVQRTIEAMSELEQRDPTWVYWRARAIQAQAKDDTQRQQARALLETIASTRGFYEQLALEELGQKITAPARPAPLSASEQQAARLNPGLNRALYAIAIGLRPEGVREWNYSTNLAKPGGMNERELLAAAQFACEREVWDRCINTSERTRGEIDVMQRFPTPLREAVLARTREIGLDPAYVYGLIRQESRFIMDAKSHVGASGLMQLMPRTAKWTARKIGLTDFRPEQVNDKDINIALGTGYLKMVLDDFADSLPLAAAAYNAGPGRPRAWRNGPVLEGAIWAENVPFAETRDYVKKVLANTTNYAAVLSGQAQSLKARLGAIGPRDKAQPEPNRELP